MQYMYSNNKEEFSYDNPNGGLTIPCSEDAFLNFSSQFSLGAQFLIESKMESFHKTKDEVPSVQISQLIYLHTNSMIYISFKRESMLKNSSLLHRIVRPPIG
ncbi:hypothetical protein S83_042124 [Arachis hypogaea]